MIRSVPYPLLTTETQRHKENRHQSMSSSYGSCGNSVARLHIGSPKKISKGVIVNTKAADADIARSCALPAGTSAPDFRLQSTPDQSLSLSEFKGAPVILCFYPADWSPVCGDQVVLYN